MPDQQDHDLALSRFWNEITETGDSTSSIEPETAALIRRLHTSANAPLPGSARERVWRGLLETYEERESDKEPATLATTDVIRPGPNGRIRTPQPILLRERAHSTNRRIALAIAAMLVIALVGGIAGGLIQDRLDSNEPRPGPAVLAPSTAAGIDVPMYRANPARTGVMPGPGPAGQPVELWRYQIQGEVHAAPAIVGGVLFIGGGDGSVLAVDVASGDEMWRFDADSRVASSPAVVEGLVYVGSDNGTLYTLDAASGEEVWSFPGTGRDASVVVVDGIVYVGSEDGFLHALDAVTGEESWRATLGDAASRSPAVANGLVYIGSGDGVLHAIDTATGAERWTFQTEGGVLGTPAVADGAVYQVTVNGDADHVYAIDAATGAEQWRFASSTGGGFFPPAVGGGTVYVPGDDGVYALGASTGSELWHVPTTAVSAAPALVGDTLYVGGNDRTLYALETATGAERWRFALEGTANYGPVVTGGVAYIGTTFGIVYAIGGSLVTVTIRDPAGAVVAVIPPSTDGPPVTAIRTQFGLPGFRARKTLPRCRNRHRSQQKGTQQ